MATHWALKTLYTFLSGIGFYLLTGDGSEALLLMILIGLLEFRYAKEPEDRYRGR